MHVQTDNPSPVSKLAVRMTNNPENPKQSKNTSAPPGENQSECASSPHPESMQSDFPASASPHLEIKETSGSAVSPTNSASSQHSDNSHASKPSR
jgi:hypothetical protein